MSDLTARLSKWWRSLVTLLGTLVVFGAVLAVTAQEQGPLQVCSTKLPATILKRLREQAKGLPAGERRSAEELALLKDFAWPNASTLRVAFLSGSPELRSAIERSAKTWSQYANVSFDFQPHQRSDIRISLTPDGRSWSYIGMQAKQIATNQPTMNFGWLTSTTPQAEVDRVVLHEFGHALGCIHEHQNPAGEIQWNKPVVLEACRGMGWSASDCQSNIFDRYAPESLRLTKLDPLSIMMYGFPKEWTLNGVGTPWNTALSQLDKEFIARLYPRTGHSLEKD